MRVVSLVPSWTETLISAGVDVVGRTRFCIHPAMEVKAIPAVGGTKDLDLETILGLRPDLVLLDREENTKEMYQALAGHPLAIATTHVRAARDVASELRSLAARWPAGEVRENLSALANRWLHVESRPPQKLTDAKRLPGVICWLSDPQELTTIVYVIWKKPWMAAGPETFIGSMLGCIGIAPEKIWPGGAQSELSAKERYPQFILEDLPRNATLLFSSEPYPFAKKSDELSELGFPCALVDGESFSWFGLRSLKFVENHLKSM